MLAKSAYRHLLPIFIHWIMSCPLSARGHTILVQLARSFAESVCPDAPPSAFERVSSAVDAMLSERIDQEDCRRIVVEAIGRDDPVVRIEEILSLSDEPLPFEEDEADESGSPSRRRTRTWTNIEDQRLLGGVVRFGLDNWQAVARYLGSGRNRAQCSQRWARGLNPKISKKAWTPEEDRELERLVKQYGEKSWAKIASILGNRSDVQCRYHYRQIMSGEEAMRLDRKHKMSMTAGEFCLEAPMSPPNAQMSDEGETFMSLARGRTFGSSPMMVSGKGKLLIPLAPITERKGLNNSVLTEFPSPKPPARFPGRWGVCGADPTSLDSFLRQFK